MKVVAPLTAIILACLSLSSCSDNATSKESIDYSRTENWASLPTFENPSMRVPTPEQKNAQAIADADVFYIYPTVYTSFFSNNASLDDKEYRADVANLLLTSQASCLNNVGRIYTPYYRQASLWAYLDTEKARKKAFDVAYFDVETAFRHYLERMNRGRPLFILSHSQGSQIAVRLLQQDWVRLQLKPILVAAYLIGERIGTDTFADLPPCETPTQTGCFVTWGTVAEGGRSDLMTGEVRGTPVCVNPLSWRMDRKEVSASHHLGGVPDTFDRVLSHLVSAKCDEGLLNIRPAPEGFAHDGKDYHESDISLFYLDIRRNAEERLRQYRREHGTEPEKR